MEILNIGSTATLQKVKKELINSGLLEQEQRGLNMANRLYLLEPIVEEEDIYEIIEDETDEIKDLSQKEDLYEQKLTESISSRKSLVPQGNSLSKLPISENGSLDNERLDIQKLNTNDTDLSKTNKDFKDNKDWKNQNDLLISGIDKINQDIVTNSVPSLFSRGRVFLLFKIFHPVNHWNWLKIFIMQIRFSGVKEIFYFHMNHFTTTFSNV